jgi:hypothetical protein
MSDISSEQFEQFMNELRKNTGSLDRVTRSLADQKNRNSKSSGSGTSAKDRARDREEDNRAKARVKLDGDLKRREGQSRKSHKLDENERGIMRRSLSGAAKGVGVLGQNSDEAGRSLSKFAGYFGMGGVIGGMIGGATNLIRTYRDTAEVGQTFNGSLFTMARSAAAAGLPLSDFADLIKKNGKTIAAFGQKDVMRLAKGVRQSTEKFGMYGYTIEGLNEVTMSYLEQQRHFGNMEAANSTRSQANSIALAKGVGDLSKAFGKGREEILKATMEAMSQAAITARMGGMTEASMENFSAAANGAVSAMAAIPGESGQLLANFMSNALGHQSALFNQGTEMFAQGGLPQMISAQQDWISAMDNAASATEGQDLSFAFMQKFKREVDANRESLRLQVLAGNTHAEQIINMDAAMKDMSAAEFRQLAQQQEANKGLTNGLLALGNIFKRLAGSVLEGLFGSLEKLDENMAYMFDSESFKNFEMAAKMLGEKIGNYFANLKPEDVERFAKTLQTGIDIAADFGKGILTLISYLTMIAAPIGHVVNAFTSGLDFIGNTFGDTAKKIALVGAGLLLWLGPKVIGGIFRHMMGSNVNINAANVIVNGGMGGGFGRGRGRRGRGGRGGGGGGRGGGGAARGSFGSRVRDVSDGGRHMGRGRGAAGVAGRLMGGGRGRLAGAVGGAALMGSMFMGDIAGAATDVAGSVAGGVRGASRPAASVATHASAGSRVARVAGGVARRVGGRAGMRGAARIGARVAGRVGGILGKKIPGVGLGVGAGLAAMRLAEGDGVGAGMEGLSSAMGTVPVIGTIGSLLMDGAILGRDLIGRDRTDRFVGGLGRMAGNAARPLARAAPLLNPMTMPAALGGMLARNFGRARPATAPDAARATEGRLGTINETLAAQTNANRANTGLFEQLNKTQKDMKGMFEAMLGIQQEQRAAARRTNVLLTQIKDS